MYYRPPKGLSNDFFQVPHREKCHIQEFKFKLYLTSASFTQRITYLQG